VPGFQRSDPFMLADDHLDIGDRAVGVGRIGSPGSTR
jgi:hypothetical protein